MKYINICVCVSVNVHKCSCVCVCVCVCVCLCLCLCLFYLGIAWFDSWPVEWLCKTVHGSSENLQIHQPIIFQPTFHPLPVLLSTLRKWFIIMVKQCPKCRKQFLLILLLHSHLLSLITRCATEDDTYTGVVIVCRLCFILLIICVHIVLHFKSFIALILDSSVQWCYQILKCNILHNAYMVCPKSKSTDFFI